MKKISGFTLMELLMVITIGAVLMAIGVPSMSGFIKDGRLTSAHNELVSAMQVARSAAIQNSGSACVCSSTTVSAATPVCDGGNNWETGWIAFVDTNTAAVTTCVFDPTDDDVLLKAWDGAIDGQNLTVRTSAAIINSIDYVRFNGRGVPLTSTGVSLQGMYKFCDDRGLNNGVVVHGKGVVLSASGSLRSTSDLAQIVSCL